jgi:hypothetical protein
MKNIEDGKLVIFKGPIKDRSGKDRVSKGEIIDSEALKKMDWVVEGVEGPMPKGN